MRLKEGPYRCAAVFVDNSGLDVILGVLPFVRELLNQGTNVRIFIQSFQAIKPLWQLNFFFFDCVIFNYL